MSISDIVMGTDIVYLPRLRTTYQLYEFKFFQRVLTSGELHYCQSGNLSNFLSRAGGRIAVKEAVSKALGVGINGLGWDKGIQWQNIEYLAKEHGNKPELTLFGKAEELSAAQHIKQWRISLSHEGEYVFATAIGLVSNIY